MLSVSGGSAWTMGYAVFGFVWVLSAWLALRGNLLAQRLSRLGLCALLGVGLSGFVYGIWLSKNGGYLDSPASELIVVVLTQVLFTAPCGVLLYFNRLRSV
ncbi:Uncharacterised protein [Halioglobus japonicus]|nr:Uncharacterised protein [Halioglobus japonicus]